MTHVPPTRAMRFTSWIASSAVSTIARDISAAIVADRKQPTMASTARMPAHCETRRTSSRPMMNRAYEPLRRTSAGEDRNTPCGRRPPPERVVSANGCGQLVVAGGGRRAAGRLELREDIRDVASDSLDRDRELGGHAPVGVSLGDAAEHVQLSLGQAPVGRQERRDGLAAAL